MLRVGEDLHRLLVIRSLQSGESLNSYCMRLLKEQTPPYLTGDAKKSRHVAKKGPAKKR